jgi:membrane associated rhomboid family serine protease
VRPARFMRGGGFFGGGSMATRLTIAVAVASIGATAASRFGAGSTVLHLLFTPALTVRGEVWQPFTYALIDPIGGGFGVFSFLISLYFLFAIGGQVEAAVGGRRFLALFVGSAAVGAIASIPFAFLLGSAATTYPGLWVALGALTILFAQIHANQPIYLMFVLPLQGKQLVWVSFGVLALLALTSGLDSILQAFFGMLAALLWSRGSATVRFSPRRAWLRFRAWRIERQLRRRSSKLSVIRGGREDENPPPPRKSEDGGGPWLH